jgi:chaperonin GroES
MDSSAAPATFRPLHDKILVKRAEADDQTSSGLYIPDTAKEKPVEGRVIAVGDGARTRGGDRVPLDVKVGDRVLFLKYSGTGVVLDGDDYIVLREDDVVAVLNEEN